MSAYDLRAELRAAYEREQTMIQSASGRRIVRAELVDDRVRIWLDDGRTIRITASEWLSVEEEKSDEPG